MRPRVEPKAGRPFKRETLRGDSAFCLGPRAYEQRARPRLAQRISLPRGREQMFAGRGRARDDLCHTLKFYFGVGVSGRGGLVYKALTLRFVPTQRRRGGVLPCGRGVSSQLWGCSSHFGG